MRETFLPLGVLAALLSLPASGALVSRVLAQSGTAGNSIIRVRVELVQMNVAVTDKKGAYVSGLGPGDFQILEDGIPQRLAIFEEGNQRRQVLIRPEEAAAPVRAGSVVKEEDAPGTRNKENVPSGSGIDLQIPPPAPPSPPRAAEAAESSSGATLEGSNIFILFDTSDYMYRDFSSAQDSMANFVHSLDALNRVAFYSYSRNLSRRVALTGDRLQVLRGLHGVAAGDDDALYSSMLLTLQEASRSKGKKVLVVFSHGPDNASSISPEEVSELAQSEGLPIYMVSTGKAQLDPVSRIVFQRLSNSTGGQAYFAENKAAEQRAFASIREDLGHLYTLSYYPRANPNPGWRTITVKLKAEERKGLTIRTRSGYRPKAGVDAEDTASPEG